MAAGATVLTTWGWCALPALGLRKKAPVSARLAAGGWHSGRAAGGVMWQRAEPVPGWG